ncbi:MAG TPA: AAA family ATPase [Pseudonocardiaceae bacterium]|jgi:ATP/maltotriose-dependent transcriptional regulator MalT|nr:AAA family ATPase [Pseudonocardiaceae bacterium]
MRGTLVGRDAELARLEHGLQQLSLQGPGGALMRVLEVVGEPGMGKTRLLAELSTRVRGQRPVVLGGQATEFERNVPFGVLVDALDDHLAAVEPPRLKQVCPDCRVVLSAVFPALVAWRPECPAHESPRYRLHRAVRVLLQELACPGGLVLILDDMHWADEASLQLIEYLLRNPPRAPLLLALAYRPRQMPAQLAAALARAVDSGDRVDRLDLSPLTLAEVRELLGPSVSPARCRTLYQESGGNPFYLDALVRAGGAARFEVDGDTAQGELLPSAQAALRAELDAVSASGRLVARAAAVAGDPFDPSLVADVARLPEPAVLDGLDELVERDLLRPTEQPRRFRYRHPLVRHVVYHSAGAGWRLDAHARAATALARNAAPPMACADHVARSALTGDDAAVALLVDAAREAMAVAPATSAQWLRTALGLLSDGAVQRRAELLRALARALGLAGQLTAAGEILHEVLLTMSDELPAIRASTVAFCAMVERLLGRHAQARALLLRELDGLSGSDGREVAVLKLELASDALLAGEFTSDRVLTEDAAELARRHGDRALEAVAVGLSALGSYAAGQVSQAGAQVVAGALLVDGLTTRELTYRLDAAVWLGWSETLLERHDSALRHFDRGLNVGGMAGQSHLHTYLLVGGAYALQSLGRLDAAAEYAADGVEAALLAASDELSSMAFTVQGLVAVQLGDLKAGRRAAERAVQTAGQDGDWWSAAAGCVLGIAHLLAGEPARCVEWMVGACGGPDLPGLDVLHRPFFLEVLVAAALAQGQVDAANKWAELAEACGLGVDLPSRVGHALLARARVLLAVGDPAAAVQGALAAVAKFTAGENRFAAGRAHLFAGNALAGIDRSRAFAELGQAKALFATCGARGALADATRALHMLGGRASGPQSPGTLSHREREIAELVAVGKTNREIAEALFMSPKTVEAHLSRIFAKLGVRARAAIGSRLAEEGHHS